MGRAIATTNQCDIAPCQQTAADNLLYKLPATRNAKKRDAVFGKLWQVNQCRMCSYLGMVHAVDNLKRCNS